MKPIRCGAFTLGLAAAVLALGPVRTEARAEPLPEDAKRELERLQGEWVVKSWERAGEKTEFERNDETPVVQIKGARWFEKGLEYGEFVVFDSRSDPKCFDLKETTGQVNFGQETECPVLEGIYKIDGDTLTICIHQGNDKQRPVSFETNPKLPEETILFILERVKKK
jgi:uncharacterized protein (TIGR03067 family)